MNYLSREGIIPESLYPKDSKARAMVQEFLEWQHVGLRLPCAMYFRVKVQVLCLCDLAFSNNFEPFQGQHSQVK